jgi:aspartyl-tRNA(Asn)/glutamyl-tRNA(Gln) amidotransferase subunit B
LEKINMKFIPIIGLEIHVELKTNSKMFCSCPNDPNEKRPNLNVCPICLGHPGTLPVINEEAVKKTIKTGLALNCQISEYSKFDRKNYFYPDLPKGYQISQLYQPLCQKGFLDIRVDSLSNSRKFARVRIREVHLEEDVGRLIHGKDYSLVDFNRAGIPLMELVTEPDIHSAKEARKFAEELQLILRYLGVSDADMEKGQMRVEANISLTKEEKKLGTKVEIKNLNSFKAVERAIDYEIKRQTKILNSGKKIIQETRGWDDVKGITVSQREKEYAQDYRYFPEPDLLPLHFEKEEIDKIRAEIPELPQQKRDRFKREYELEEKPIEVFIQNKDLGEYFEKVISEFDPNLSREKLFKLIKLATNYLITDLQGLLKGASVSGEDFLITPENFAQFITLIEEGKISSKIAKIVLEEMFKTGADPSHIIEEKGLILITSEAEIEKIAKEVISENQKAASDFKKGKETAFQFLIGQIMAKTKGKANPQIAKEILTRILKEIK